MLNFSNHHSLKRRFQSVIAVLIFLYPKQNDQSLNLSQLVDQIIRGDRSLSPSPDSQIYLQIEAIILGLYHHQDLPSLIAHIPQAEYLTTALAIALCCRGEMQTRTLVSKLCPYLKTDPDFCNQLYLAHSLADQGSSQAIAKSVIPENTLPFGLYCFVSTPYSWKLVHQGANQMPISAIAAAYLGHMPELSPENLNLTKKISDRLLGAWSGVYDWDHIPANFYPSLKYPVKMSLGA